MNCGHGNEPPIIASKGSAYVVPFSKEDIYPPIGEHFTPRSVQPIEVPFAEGDMLVLYTDGITEIFRDTEDEKSIVDEYSKDRLLASVCHEIGKSNWSAASAVEGICKDAESYSLSSRILEANPLNGKIDSATDDITLAALRWEEVSL